MDNSPSFPNSYVRLDQSDARDLMVASTQVFELRDPVSQSTLTSFKTENGIWVCHINYFCGDSEYYRMAEDGFSESLLLPLLLEDWKIESYATDQLTEVLRRAGQHE